MIRWVMETDQGEIVKVLHLYNVKGLEVFILHEAETVVAELPNGAVVSGYAIHNLVQPVH